MTSMTIGQAAAASGVKVPTIRYYEEIGLLPHPSRTGSNRRLYGFEDLQRLSFIRHARELGFEIESIRHLLDLAGSPQKSCEKVDAIARTHLAEVERRIDSLQRLKLELQRMIEGCRHGQVEDCRILEVVRDHDQCAHDHAKDAAPLLRPRTAH